MRRFLVSHAFKVPVAISLSLSISLGESCSLSCRLAPRSRPGTVRGPCVEYHNSKQRS
jgi:hypothetical protein